ncbi:MAG: ABC transporter permease [Candidatus Comchoanobacterales bacterium]
MIALLTILRKELVRIFRIWPQTLVPPVINTSMYFIVFGTILAQRINMIDGVAYVKFIAPGLVMMSVIINSYSNVSGSFFIERWHGSLNQLLVAPVSVAHIVFGYIFAGVLRGLLTGLFVYVCAYYFITDVNQLPISVHHYDVAIVVGILTAMIFSTLGLINAIWAKNFDQISIVPTFLLTPLLYLGGVFYSIYNLPPTWQHIARFNPVVYIVDILRYGLVGSELHYGVWLVLAILALVAFGLFMLAVYFVEQARSIRP